MILVLMGVMGTGKTTIARLFTQQTGWAFAEGDDYHPPINVEKMHAGTPLTDADRAPWLAALHAQILIWDQQKISAVLTCSALKHQYRDVLKGDIPSTRLRFVFLEASRAVLEQHLAARQGHFMNNSLLDSQLAILEVPADAIHINVEHSPQSAVGQLKSALKLP